jgi:hypothetical protein
MTLILTAIYKNGICVCADKRRTTWNNGTPNHEDNLNKIYKFNDIPLIIFNHGINEFKNKPWNEFCIEYENSGRWKDKKFFQIVDNFKNFIERNIHIDLISNKQYENKLTGFTNKTGFVFCGKTEKDNKFEINEFFWSLGSNDELICKTYPYKEGYIISGLGEKYLKIYLKIMGNKLNNSSYWKKLNDIQVKKELQKLFIAAATEKRKQNGDEFSDIFDIMCIEEQHFNFKN